MPGVKVQDAVDKVVDEEVSHLKKPQNLKFNGKI